MVRPSYILTSGLLALTILSACSVERKADSTANNRILKAKCQRGFDMGAINKTRAEKLAGDAYAQVRTFLAQDDLEGFSSAVPRFVEQSVEVAAAEGNLIDVEKNCVDLKARVQLPGHEVIEDAEIQNVDMTSMDLKVGSTQIRVELAGTENADVQKALNAQGFNKIVATVTRLSAQRPGQVAKYVIVNQTVNVSRPTDTVDVDGSALTGVAGILPATEETSVFMSKVANGKRGNVTVTVEEMMEVQAAHSRDLAEQQAVTGKPVERAIIPRDIPAVDAGVDEAVEAPADGAADVATEQAPAAAGDGEQAAAPAQVDEIIVTAQKVNCAKDDDACWDKHEKEQNMKRLENDEKYFCELAAETDATDADKKDCDDAKAALAAARAN